MNSVWNPKKPKISQAPNAASAMATGAVIFQLSRRNFVAVQTGWRPGRFPTWGILHSVGSNLVTRRVYPPQNHILRHLELVHTSLPDGSVRATMPVYDDLRDAGGWLRLGAIATLVDSVAGHHGVRQVTPDWVATLHLGTVLERGAVGDRVVAECAPLRVGRNNVVTETTVNDDDGQIARSICTYARLPARSDNPSVGTHEQTVIEYFEDTPLEPRPALDEYLLLEPRATEPIVDVIHHPRIHNSFGSIQGGAAVILMERAAAHLATLVNGDATRAVSADVHYLSQAKGGPFEARAELLSVHGDHVTARVRIFDVGNDDRLLSVGTVATASMDPKGDL